MKTFWFWTGGLILLCWAVYSTRPSPPITNLSPGVDRSKKHSAISPKDKPPHIRIAKEFWESIYSKDIIFIDDGKGNIAWQGTPAQFKERIDTLNAVATRMGSTDTVEVAGSDTTVVTEENAPLLPGAHLTN